MEPFFKVVRMNEYEGFSKQDLIDRRNALETELNETIRRKMEIWDEMDLIDKLLKRD